MVTLYEEGDMDAQPVDELDCDHDDYEIHSAMWHATCNYCGYRWIASDVDVRRYFNAAEAYAAAMFGEEMQRQPWWRLLRWRIAYVRNRISDWWRGRDGISF